MARPTLARTIAELEADPGYADGDRPFPRRLDRDEAADVADAIHAEITAAAEQRDRDAATAGVVLACAPGCAFCCEELVLVAAPEAAAVGRWLADPARDTARDQFLAAYSAWREAVGTVPEKLAALTAAGDYEGQQRLYLEQYQRRVMCGFNHQGRCLIYPVRPIGCHHAHAVDTAEYCRSDHPSGRPPTRFGHSGFAAAIGRGHLVMRAAHHAMGAPRGTPRSLCVAVYQQLTGSPDAEP